MCPPKKRIRHEQRTNTPKLTSLYHSNPLPLIPLFQLNIGSDWHKQYNRCYHPHRCSENRWYRHAPPSLNTALPKDTSPLSLTHRALFKLHR
jgi:hypothetical protein